MYSMYSHRQMSASIGNCWDKRQEHRTDIMNQCAFLLATYDDIPEIVGIYHSLIGTPGCTWDYEYPNIATDQSDIDSKSLYILKKNHKIIAVASAGRILISPI